MDRFEYLNVEYNKEHIKKQVVKTPCDIYFPP